VGLYTRLARGWPFREWGRLLRAYQKVTILLPGQMVLDVAESINIINTGLQTRFLGEGIMVSKVGLVVGCYRFTDNHNNATMTRMVCFHNALTTPEGTELHNNIWRNSGRDRFLGQSLTKTAERMDNLT